MITGDLHKAIIVFLLIPEYCHFEVNFCDWSQEKQYDDFDWKRGKGSETGDVGAPVDKTTNTAEGL